MNFGFGIESDQSISSKIDIAVDLGNSLREFFKDRDYGEDIKTVSIGVILFGKDDEQVHPIRSLKYKKKWTCRPTPKSAPMILTNIVEYDIRPDYDAFCCMSYQEGTKYLAELLLESIGVIAANMKKYPHFDFERFALDLKEALEQIVATNLSDPHTAVGGGGLERSGVNSQLSDNHSSTSKRPIEDFPIEALTFVERELPNVHWAVEQKNRELLKPVLARAQEFLNRWGLGGKYTPALDAYPGYATLVTDVLREGAVELMETTDEERARVHEDFRKRWDACKAAMSQDRRPRSH